MANQLLHSRIIQIESPVPCDTKAAGFILYQTGNYFPLKIKKDISETA